VLGRSEVERARWKNVEIATSRPRRTAKPRQSILEGLGWNIQHIWSTDWWHDPEQQAKKLIKRLETLNGKRK
jgi:hypothetical protein